MTRVLSAAGALVGALSTVNLARCAYGLAWAYRHRHDDASTRAVAVG